MSLGSLSNCCQSWSRLSEYPTISIEGSNPSADSTAFRSVSSERMTIARIGSLISAPDQVAGGDDGRHGARRADGRPKHEPDLRIHRGEDQHPGLLRRRADRDVAAVRTRGQDVHVLQYLADDG